MSGTVVRGFRCTESLLHLADLDVRDGVVGGLLSVRVAPGVVMGVRFVDVEQALRCLSEAGCAVGADGRLRVLAQTGTGSLSEVTVMVDRSVVASCGMLTVRLRRALRRCSVTAMVAGGRA